jgi:transglutaminase-like putative cysteine protease
MRCTYQVEHKTQYVYETGVSTSHHIACLEPRELPYQHLKAFDLSIDPVPARLVRRVDYFGNVRHQFQLLGPHDRLTVTARAVIDVLPRPANVIGGTGSWECACEWFRHPPRDAVLDVSEYLGPSPQVMIDRDIEVFARESFRPGRTVYDGAVELTHRIHDEFTFDPTATTPSTPVAKVLAARRGVCQDFAHFQIACVRSLGLAARYVSGYLRTDPPPGQPRQAGADASHAWVSVYVPGMGWLDLDPTNDTAVDQGHVTIGWGRDYSDVTPLRGVLLGGARHRLLVGVSVIPMRETHGNSPRQ